MIADALEEYNQSHSGEQEGNTTDSRADFLAGFGSGVGESGSGLEAVLAYSFVCAISVTALGTVCFHGS